MAQVATVTTKMKKMCGNVSRPVESFQAEGVFVMAMPFTFCTNIQEHSNKVTTQVIKSLKNLKIYISFPSSPVNFTLSRSISFLQM